MARTIDPDRSADCHASGAVPTAAYLVRGEQLMTLCGHHLGLSATNLAAQGWEVIPAPHAAGEGVGTEATPAHYSLNQ